MAKFVDSTTSYQPPPPYAFHNVKQLMFLVDADLAGLIEYCDKFLNGVGDPDWKSPYHYTPLAPIGYLGVLYYPFMESLIPKYAEDGYWRQNELYFTFPVVRSRKIGTLLVPMELNFAIPFIAVDQPLSAICGRQVLGMEKLIGTYDLSRQDGVPATPLDWQKLKLSVEGTTQLTASSAGHVMKALEITLGNDILFDRSPFAEQLKDLTEYAPDPKKMQALLALIPTLPLPGILSTVTLKQFRNPVDVNEAIYKALVRFDTAFEDVRFGQPQPPIDNTTIKTGIKIYKDNADLKLALAWTKGLETVEDGRTVVEFSPLLAWEFTSDMTVGRKFETVVTETPPADSPTPGGNAPDSCCPVSQYSTGVCWNYGPFAGEARLGLRSGT